MYEMQTIVTDVRGVCQSVCHAGHSVLPLLNHYDLLLFL